MGFWEFVLSVVIIGTIGSLANNWIKARHGYPINDEKDDQFSDDDGHLKKARKENRALKEQVAKLEARLAVLERIATDPAERTAREIELLR